MDARLEVLDMCDKIANKCGRPFAWWKIETESKTLFNRHFWLLDTQQKLEVLRRVEASCENRNASEGGPAGIGTKDGPPVETTAEG